MFYIPRVHFQTDILKELPQNLDSVKYQKLISDVFGTSEAVFILFKMNTSKDIRNPAVLSGIQEIMDKLLLEPDVLGVVSPTRTLGFFPYVPQNQVFLRSILNNSLFSRSYDAALLIVYSDIGSGEKEITNFVSKIRDVISGSDLPRSVDVVITGNAPVRALLMNILEQDMVITMVAAGILIFLLLVVIQRSFARGLLAFIPLLFGISWTLGIIGFLNFPLSIATTGLGAMILGLGTEYGIFFTERYLEARRKYGPKEALMDALPSVGVGIIGSSTTTILGFLALLLSTMGMIQRLGITLALGIACTLISTIFVVPVFAVFLDRWLHD
jgi:predicted RND superfamily exporter protein